MSTSERGHTRHHQEPIDPTNRGTAAMYTGESRGDSTLSKNGSQVDAGVRSSASEPTHVQSPSALECSRCKATPDWSHGRNTGHLSVCAKCRTHEIEALEAAIEKLRAEDRRLRGENADVLSPEDEQELKREAKLTKIPAEKYREVKHWTHGELGDASVLLMTSDGANYGIRRFAESTEQRIGRQPDSSRTISAETAGRRQQTDVDVPFRLVLNSSELLRILSKVTGSKLLPTNHVHLRPFKYFIQYEAEIRDALSHFRMGCQASASQMSGSITDVTVKGIKVTPRGKDLIQCVVDFMDTEMHDIFAIRKQVADRTLESISFEYLWHLYKPGDLVFSKAEASSGPRRAYRVLNVTGGRPNVDRNSNQRKRRPRRRNRSQSRSRSPSAGGLRIHPMDTVSPGVVGKSAKMTPVVIDCLYIDFDGEWYGPRPWRFILPEFNSHRKICDLEIYPAEFDLHFRKVKQDLIERGRAYFGKSAQGMHWKYNGRSLVDVVVNGTRMPRRGFSTTSEGRVVELDCECLIDQKAAIDSFDPDYVPSREGRGLGLTSSNKLGYGTGVISEPTETNTDEIFETVPYCSKQCVSCTDVFDDSTLDIDARMFFVHGTTLIEKTREPDDDHFILLPARIFGFALQHREWFALNIDNLTEIRSQKQAEAEEKPFDNLVLPKEHKQIVQALIKHQTRNLRRGSGLGPEINKLLGAGDGFDLIHGKGRGLVILLHGAPGVGKTSTAESVAIQLQRPLLPITSGDLGTEAEEVDLRLEHFFSLAARWSCVVLLDECEVFLARRVTGDPRRNSLVSVFLRRMEYFSGVLILTTNRVGEFDEACVSRIHMKLYYPALDEKSTMDIWDMNIRRAKENKQLNIDIREDDIIDFASKYWKKNVDKRGRQWNGRQIKNAFQTAVALAFWEWENPAMGKKRRSRPVLKKSHFNAIAGPSLLFDQYIDKVHGAHSEGAFSELAARSQLRDDGELIDFATTPSPAPRLANRLGRGGWRPQVTVDDGKDAEISRLQRLLAMQTGSTTADSQDGVSKGDSESADDDDDDDDDDD